MASFRIVCMHTAYTRENKTTEKNKTPHLLACLLFLDLFLRCRSHLVSKIINLLVRNHHQCSLILPGRTREH